MCCRQHRVVVNEDLENEGNVPAPLNLPFGKLFFGFNIAPYVPPPVPEDAPVSEVCAFGSQRFFFLFFITHTPS
jgi:ubiquitin fusion degradation protein 1